MLRQFTLIKLQLALKLSCINFSSVYREQDRWLKLHTIWGNARDICYCVNCLKLRFLSPFWAKDVCSHAYWIRWRVSCSNEVCTDFSPSCQLLLCCKDLLFRGALLPLTPASPLPSVGCRGKGVRGSPADTPGSWQILLGIKPGEGKSLLSMKLSSLLHC